MPSSRVKSRMEEGGLAGGWARIVATLMLGAGGINERELEAGRKACEQHPKLARLLISERKRLPKEQSYMVQLDPDRVIESLASLLPIPEERREAWNMAKVIAIGDGMIDASSRWCSTGCPRRSNSRRPDSRAPPRPLAGEGWSEGSFVDRLTRRRPCEDVSCFPLARFRRERLTAHHERHY